jgi:hypothetical protein
MRALLCLALICVAVGEFNAQFWNKAARSSQDDVHSVVFHVASIPKALATCDSMLMEVMVFSSPVRRRSNAVVARCVKHAFLAVQRWVS